MSDELDSEQRQKEFSEAMQMFRYEGTLLWQRFAVFLVLHVLLGGSLLRVTVEADTPQAWPGLLVSLLGIVLWVPWATTVIRGYAIFKVRVDIAEKAQPKGWDILNHSRFRKSSPLLRPFQAVSVSRSAEIVIAVFGIIYLVSAIYCACRMWHH